MSQSSFPVFSDQGGLFLHCFQIVGADVQSGLSTDGLDLRGAQLATISVSGAVQTVVFNQAMVNAYVFLQELTDNGAGLLALTTNAAGNVTGFTITGETRDAHGTPLDNQNWFVQVYEYKTDQVVQ